ncbi:MAG: DUF3097 domain-containing protein [Propionibacteriaceae bacterium]|jgi:hypothetical protein|nr:DUF3097 domain-containing protein [Propionibacteriaceae bacterium]
MTPRYSDDVLSPGWQRRDRPLTRPVTAEIGLVLEDPQSGFCGAIVTWENGLVVLEDRHGKRRSFPFGPGFWLEGQPVSLDQPRVERKAPGQTASGSRVAPVAPAKVAAASRIWVEGLHDAELIEKVWGDDLRYIGVVVEPLGGIDHLDDRLNHFGPTAQARVGVLVDHLVAGSKESRLIEQVRRRADAAAIFVTGHDFVDIWQAVKPTSLGVAHWPVVAKGTDWKQGICQGLGWPAATPTDVARAWRRILARVNSWTDLDHRFVQEVEKLIDFVQPDDLGD